MITGKLRGALYLGLDRENIDRLVSGQPIRIPAGRLRMLGLPEMTVLINFGETQQVMLDEIAAFGEKLEQGEDTET